MERLKNLTDKDARGFALGFKGRSVAKKYYDMIPDSWGSNKNGPYAKVEAMGYWLRTEPISELKSFEKEWLRKRGYFIEVPRCEHCGQFLPYKKNGPKGAHFICEVKIALNRISDENRQGRSGYSSKM